MAQIRWVRLFLFVLCVVLTATLSVIVSAQIRKRFPRVPVITSLSPSSYFYQSIPANERATDKEPARYVLTVSGRHFRPQATVYFLNKALKTHFVSSTCLKAMLPVALIKSIPTDGLSYGKVGRAKVTVRNPGPGARHSAPTTFTLMAEFLGG